MRVTTAYNRMLGLAGGWVRDVAFGEQGMIVTVALRRKQPLCSGCGARGLRIKDHRTKRWRHLDVGGGRCYIECRLRRLYCPGCGDLPEHVEWARGGARCTRDFDDLGVDPLEGRGRQAVRLEVSLESVCCCDVAGVGLVVIRQGFWCLSRLLGASRGGWPGDKRFGRAGRSG